MPALRMAYQTLAIRHVRFAFCVKMIHSLKCQFPETLRELML